MGDAEPKEKRGASGPAVRFEAVSRVYRDFWGRRRTWALRDLSLEVIPGEIYGLLGPNGSGKTTALKLIMGLIRLTAGSVVVLGRRPGDLRSLERIGYLPEEPGHYGFLSGLENLEFYGTLFGLERSERKKRARDLIAALGLDSLASRPVREYSRGMVRRLGIAQALVNQPDLLILDEPTSGLDPVAHRIVTDLFLEMRKEGKTVLISTHLLSDVEKVCDRIGMLVEGGLLLQGQVGDLLEVDDATECRIRGIDDEAIRRAIQAGGGEIESLRAPRRTLEDLFLRALKKRKKE